MEWIIANYFIVFLGFFLFMSGSLPQTTLFESLSLRFRLDFSINKRYAMV